MLRGKQRSYSMRTILIFSEVVLFVIFIAMLAAYSVYSIRSIQKQFFEKAKDSVALQCNVLDTFLKQTNEYLIALSASTAEIDIISKHDTSSTEYHLASRRIQNAFQTGFRYLKCIDETFMFTPDTGVYIQYTNSTLDYETRVSAREKTRQYILENTPSYSGWFPIKINDGYILVKLLPVENSYLGVWSSAETLLNVFQTGTDTSLEQRVLITEDNRPMNSNLVGEAPLIINEVDGIATTMLAGQRYLATQGFFQYGNFSMLELIYEKTLVTQFRALYPMILIMVFVIVVAVTAMVYTLNSVSASLASMVDVMNHFRQGNWEITYQHKERYTEFVLFSNTFNAMVSEIKKLKVDVYEEKLQKESMMQQYYQMQIKPHFFINSLNMIYQFAQAKEYKLIQKLEMHMSSYFRRSLKNRERFIRLSDELAFVNEYLEIQKMRYPHHLQIQIDADESLFSCLIPPLIIQTFVENAIKYSVSTDHITEIKVEIMKEQTETRQDMKIIVCDNGEGFCPQVLCKLEGNMQVTHGERECLGIYNAQQRLRLLYRDSASIAFRNVEPHGACVEIRIPITLQQEERHDSFADCR